MRGRTSRLINYVKVLPEAVLVQKQKCRWMTCCSLEMERDCLILSVLGTESPSKKRFPLEFDCRSVEASPFFCYGALEEFQGAFCSSGILDVSKKPCVWN